jgi:predicted ATPase
MIFDNSVICPVFIGRESDLRLLGRLILQARGGNGQIALISGEAGIGKSRLVTEYTETFEKNLCALCG